MAISNGEDKPLLQAAHLVKRYGDLLAVDDLNCWAQL